MRRARRFGRTFSGRRRVLKECPAGERTTFLDGVYDERVMETIGVQNFCKSFALTLTAAVTVALSGALGAWPSMAQTAPVPNAQLADRALNARVDALVKKM